MGTQKKRGKWKYSKQGIFHHAGFSQGGAAFGCGFVDTQDASSPIDGKPRQTRQVGKMSIMTVNQEGRRNKGKKRHTKQQNQRGNLREQLRIIPKVHSEGT